MKPRARRITVGAAGLVAAVLAGFVAIYWGPVRDHVEAWHFQLTRETMTIEPGLKRGLRSATPTNLFWLLAERSGQPVIFDSMEDWTLYPSAITEAETLLRNGVGATGILKANSFRFLEQRLPRRAYVVIRDAYSREERPPPVNVGIGLAPESAE